MCRGEENVSFVRKLAEDSLSDTGDYSGKMRADLCTLLYLKIMRGVRIHNGTSTGPGNVATYIRYGLMHSDKNDFLTRTVACPQ